MSTVSGAPILVADQAGRRYGDVVALDAVHLAVVGGECVAIVGESGSGKTTLLRCFNRLVEPDTGRILVDGQDAATVDPILLRRHVGYVPQEGGLLPHWSVLRNAALVPWLLGRPDSRNLARRALDLAGLAADQFGDRRPSQLSGGQRQRVAIARALAAEPSIILLDEPFGALDAITRAELQDAFLRLRRNLGVTALLVTHDMHEAFLLADRVAVMRGGRIEQIGSPDELVTAPASPYVTELLSRSRVVPA